MTTKSLAAQTRPRPRAKASKAKNRRQPATSPMHNNENLLKYKIPVINNIERIKISVKNKVPVINKMHKINTNFSGCTSLYLRQSV